MKMLPPIKHIAFIKAPIAKVYETLTTAKGWDSWFTNGTTLNLEEKRLEFIWTLDGPYKANGKETGPIISAIPNKEFSFIWHEGAHDTTVKFVLDIIDEGTKITVTEVGYSTTDEGMWQMLECACGWGEALILLKFYLEHGITYRTAFNLN